MDSYQKAKDIIHKQHGCAKLNIKTEATPNLLMIAR